tara:strand:+ start:4284 stop:4787 length:504 start_codon:yes stop_codon:yes gene_type:complete
MKKVLLFLFVLFVTACEEEVTDEVNSEMEESVASIWNGTYKQITQDCEGREDIVYASLEVDSSETTLTANVYDYAGDACDGGSDCYFTLTETFVKRPEIDGWTNSGTEDVGNGEIASYERFLSKTSDGFRVTTEWDMPSNPDYPVEIIELATESSDIKTYLPACPEG